MENYDQIIELWKSVKTITDQQGQTLNNVSALIDVIKKLTARVEYLERHAAQEETSRLEANERRD